MHSSAKPGERPAVKDIPADQVPPRLSPLPRPGTVPVPLRGAGSSTWPMASVPLSYPFHPLLNIQIEVWED